MIIDALLQFSDKQELSGEAESTNVVDLGQERPTPGMSKVLDVAVTVAEDVTGTLQVKLQHSDEEDGTYEDVASGALLTDPEAGTKINIKVPYVTKRYLRVYYGGAPTAGVVNAMLLWGVDESAPFPQAPSLEGLWPSGTEQALEARE